ncbi:hypothetical protein SCOR_17150 [Sulfidibacter corallicola]
MKTFSAFPPNPVGPTRGLRRIRWALGGVDVKSGEPCAAFTLISASSPRSRPSRAGVREPRTTRVTVPAAPHPSLYCVVPSGRPLEAGRWPAFLSMVVQRDVRSHLQRDPGRALPTMRHVGMIVTRGHPKAWMFTVRRQSWRDANLRVGRVFGLGDHRIGTMFGWWPFAANPEGMANRMFGPSLI